MHDQANWLTKLRSLPVAVRLVIACVICLLIGAVIIGAVLWGSDLRNSLK